MRKDVSDLILNLNGRQLDYGFFIDALIEDIVFPNLGDNNEFIFKGAIFRNVVFRNIRFLGADIGEAKFENCSFFNCSLAKCDMYKTEFHHCCFKNTNFRGIRLIEGLIEYCIFCGVDFHASLVVKSMLNENIMSDKFKGELFQTKLKKCLWGESYYEELFVTAKK